MYKKAYNANPTDNAHLLDTIRGLEIELELDPIKNVYGWGYFEEVCYLYQKQIDELKSSRKEIDFQYDIVFNHLNKLVYLQSEISYLTENETKWNSTRAKKAPIKEIIKILEYIPFNNEAVTPLIKLIASIEGDHDALIKTLDHKIMYLIEKEQDKKLQKPRLNNDVLSELKEDYKTEIKLLHGSMKKYNQRKYKTPTKELLKLLNLPEQPSQI